MGVWVLLAGVCGVNVGWMARYWWTQPYRSSANLYGYIMSALLLGFGVTVVIGLATLAVRAVV